MQGCKRARSGGTLPPVLAARGQRGAASLGFRSLNTSSIRSKQTEERTSLLSLTSLFFLPFWIHPLPHLKKKVSNNWLLFFQITLLIQLDDSVVFRDFMCALLFCLYFAQGLSLVFVGYFNVFPYLWVFWDTCMEGQDC